MASSSVSDLQVAYFAKGASSSTPLAVTQGAPTSANVLSGFVSAVATTAATTIITIPAGRTWQGVIGINAAVANAAALTTAGQARGVISIAGAGAVPSGNVMAIEAKAGANGATGTVGSNGDAYGQTNLTAVAPAGNSVTIQVTTTIAGSVGVVDAWATGALV